MKISSLTKREEEFTQHGSCYFTQIYNGMYLVIHPVKTKKENIKQGHMFSYYELNGAMYNSTYTDHNTLYRLMDDYNTKYMKDKIKRLSFKNYKYKINKKVKILTIFDFLEEG